MTELVSSKAADASTGPPPSLEQLADVVQPPPVPWTPQTVGWEVLAVVLAVLLLWLLWRAVRRYWRNRYRRDALAELRQLQATFDRDPGAGASVLVALPVLIKRCALSAWPREQVASLSGPRWAQFIEAHAGHAVHGAHALAPLVREMSYHGPESLARVSVHDVDVLLVAARQWIEGHASA